MRKLVASVGIVVLVLAAYLLAWPVPIDPVAWDAPKAPGYVGPFAPNDRLAGAQSIDLGEYEGPEDVVLGADGHVYATSHTGHIVRITTDGAVSALAEVGGRPLGIESGPDGKLYVANAYSGVQRVSLSGEVESLVSEVDGEPLRYADDLAVSLVGAVYFSDATNKFGAEQWGGTMPAALLDLMEHGPNGRIIAFDPASGETSVLMKGLSFANGVALSADEESLLITETGAYRIHRYWLEGPKKGESEVILENAPGFLDNINPGRDGRYWVGLISPRNNLVDSLSSKPFVRKVIQRLPAAVRPKPVDSMHAFAIDSAGNVLVSLQAEDPVLPRVTGAVEVGDRLYLTRLIGHALPYISVSDAL